MRKNINISSAPKPIGPYNQAVLAGDMLYISGQICIDPKTGKMQDQSIETETHQVMKNIGSLLQEANLDYSHLVKCSIFLKSMDDYSVINDIYASYFKDGIYPAREAVQVSVLPKNVRIEISAIAYIS